MRHSAYVFDAYGTLSTCMRPCAVMPARSARMASCLSDIWRAKQLEYSWVRTLMGAYADFWELTEQALDFAFRKVPGGRPACRPALLEAYWHLTPSGRPAGPDSVESGRRTACHPVQRFACHARSGGLVGRARPDSRRRVLGRPIRRFKTDPAVYDIVITGWRLYPESVSFQSSNRWDVAGATRFGFRTVWINRSGSRTNIATFTVPDLAFTRGPCSAAAERERSSRFSKATVGPSHFPAFVYPL